METRHIVSAEILAHINLASLLADLGKQCRLRSDAASDHGLHCLLTGIFIKNETSTPDSPKIGNGRPIYKNGMVH